MATRRGARASPNACVILCIYVISVPVVCGVDGWELCACCGWLAAWWFDRTVLLRVARAVPACPFGTRANEILFSARARVRWPQPACMDDRAFVRAVYIKSSQMRPNQVKSNACVPSRTATRRLCLSAAVRVCVCVNACAGWVGVCAGHPVELHIAMPRGPTTAHACRSTGEQCLCKAISLQLTREKDALAPRGPRRRLGCGGVEPRG